MYARVITFELNGLNPTAYRAYAEEVAPGFTTWPGLIEKVWLAQDASGRCGGFYLFADKAAADASRESELFQAMTAANAPFTDVRIEEYDVLAGPTGITSSQTVF